MRVLPSIDADYYDDLEKALNSSSPGEMRWQSIVDAPFYDKTVVTKLGLGIIVLLIVNPDTKTVDRVALSNTYHAQGAVKMSEKPFESIKIPIDYNDNLIVAALSKGKPQRTDDWQYLFIPELTAEQARYNQAGADITCSVVYPLPTKTGAALIFSYYRDTHKKVQERFMKRYAQLVAQVL